MGTKMTVAFAVIFMAHIEKQLLTSCKSHKSFLCKRSLMTSFVCEPFPKPKATNSLISLTHFTPFLDSSTKFHQKKIFSSILKFLQDRDLPIAKSLMFKHNASPQKRSNIHTSLYATF